MKGVLAHGKEDYEEKRPDEESEARVRIERREGEEVVTGERKRAQER